ncbi:hypothetical protein [Photobacterium alginatilyticum]|uniref:Response regulator n=1 Tax=Photobacterium alginatilyticum TaxID=1775171 RepID=A0ABW9YK87_9GAMM|nr:hypothetical protein [Photobacterium alginatilyticum]NBI54211.1 hypothetical protein [Photobacterium alginatilyticum]
MSKSVALNEHIYNLLIVRDLDHFTVTELRDALLETGNINTDKNETRKFVYRQVSRLVLKGYLEKSTEKGFHNAVYSKTLAARSTRFHAKKNNLTKSQEASKIAEKSPGNNKIEFLSAIKRERNELEVRQAIALREIDKFKELLHRFPDEQSYIRPFFVEARRHATDVQGDLEAVTKLIDNHPLSQGCHE